VLRPERVEAAALPGSADITIPPYTLALQGERPVPEATGGRTFREEDFAVLGRLHPEVAKLFNGVRVGDPLSRQQAMFLDAASVGLDAPSAALTFPAPAAETAAPSASLRPKPRPDAGITIPPYTLALQGEKPVPEDILTRVVKGAIDRAEAGPELPRISSIPGASRVFMEEDLAVLGSLHPDVAALFIGMRPGDPLSPQQAMFLDAARVGSATPTATLTPPQYTVRKAPPLQGPPVPVPISAPESLYPPSGFTQDQLERMSPQMRAMAEEYNLENLGSMRP